MAWGLALLQHDLVVFLQAAQDLRLGAVRDSSLHGDFLFAILAARIGNFNEGFLVFVVEQCPFGTCRTLWCSSRMISALAVMAAFNSPPGLLMETRTSKVVTLSFSAPMGEI